MVDYEHVHPLSRAEWRKWLAANHDKSPGIWLVQFKKVTGKPSLAYDDIVEEALCFGWVDSRANTLDHERSLLMITPRKPKSAWSRPNKQRIERLTAAGLMTEPGLASVKAAKANGYWTALDAIEDLIMPADLAKALTRNKKAKSHFEAFPPSVKKQIYWWIVSAKRPETRQKRIAETVRLAADSVRANQYQPKS